LPATISWTSERQCPFSEVRANSAAASSLTSENQDARKSIVLGRFRSETPKSEFGASYATELQIGGTGRQIVAGRGARIRPPAEFHFMWNINDLLISLFSGAPVVFR
jgi:hypothetical protein